MDPLLHDIRELLSAAEVPQAATGLPAAAEAVACNAEEHRMLRTRVAHLEAEQETLRASHTEALAAAIEEREQRLREQQEHTARLQAVMMMAADGIVTVDETGTIESFNEAACRIFGYRPEEAIGQSVALLIPPSPPQRQEEDLWRPREMGSGDSEGACREVLGRRRDGSTFPLELAVSDVRLGERRLFTGICRDITRRRMLEAQLRQAQKLESIGQLAAGIAHEINTPTQYIGDNIRFLEEAFANLRELLSACEQLRAAVAAAQLSPALLGQLAEATAKADAEYLLEEIPKAIRQSLEGAERVAKIVRSMKEFSHPGGEEKQAIDLNRAIDSTLTVTRNEWKYVADVTTELDPHLPLVNCLPGDINQVILNLIINAAHAIAEKIGRDRATKGRITVGTRREGDWVEIRVADTGTGIPEAIRPRIYDPFFTTKPVGRGTGQGLAIAHAVVTERHGGTIRFETEVGRGTTFIVRLPLGHAISAAGDRCREEAHSVR